LVSNPKNQEPSSGTRYLVENWVIAWTRYLTRHLSKNLANTHHKKTLKYPPPPVHILEKKLKHPELGKSIILRKNKNPEIKYTQHRY
jgi:hypothetical protein